MRHNPTARPRWRRALRVTAALSGAALLLYGASQSAMAGVRRTAVGRDTRSQMDLPAGYRPWRVLPHRLPLPATSATARQMALPESNNPVLGQLPGPVATITPTPTRRVYFPPPPPTSLPPPAPTPVPTPPPAGAPTLDASRGDSHSHADQDEDDDEDKVGGDDGGKDKKDGEEDEDKEEGDD